MTPTVLGSEFARVKWGGSHKAVRRSVFSRLIGNAKKPMKTKNSRFDSLVARYYTAVYSFASPLTDDPREVVVLTRDAFNAARKQLRNQLYALGVY
jgi:hypothetical protein